MSLAVLDFENLTRDSNDLLLGQGLAEELTSRLSGVTRLTVRSRSVVRRLHNVDAMTITDISRALTVAYLVRGSLRRAGDRLRVTAELLRAANGAVVWSSRYDRSDGDMLAIQDAVGTAVAEAVAGRLLPAERTSLARRPTSSAEAHNAYLRGRAVYVQAASREETLGAMALFRRAVFLDSTFSEAWAYFSISQMSAFWSYLDRTAARLDSALAAAERARALAPNAAVTHLAMGYFHYWGSRNYGRALQEFSAALAADPNDPQVHVAIANVARRQGSFELSLASRTRAIDLDPTNAGEIGERGATFRVMRRYDEAERDFRRALSIEPERVAARLYLLQLALMRDGDFSRVATDLDSVAAHPQRSAEISWGTTLTLAVWRLPGPHQEALVRANPGAAVEARIAHYLAGGQVLSSQGRRDEATAAFDSVVALVQGPLRDRPDDALYRSTLALANAGRGRCEDALAEGARAATLLPVSVDAFAGPRIEEFMAEIEVACGRPEQAIDRLTYLLGVPSNITRPRLRADPAFAPLHGNPRFERLIN